MKIVSTWWSARLARREAPRTRSGSRSVFALGLIAALAAAPVEASPRSDMRKAYADALRLFNDLELDQALATIDGAIQKAERGPAAEDPVLASLYLMKAALLYSNAGEEARDPILAAMQRAVALNYFVVMPLEVRSDGLNQFLELARQNGGQSPDEAIGHVMPETACGEDIHVEALLTVPDGGEAAVYWRRQGTGEYYSLTMNVFSNVAEAVIAADEHQDHDLDYFIYAFDAGEEPVANLGNENQPLTLQLGCIEAKPEPVVQPKMNTGPSLEEQVAQRRKRREGGIPRFMLNLGVGTGAGLARGQVEHTWQQYFPANQAVDYTWEDHACAIARFNADKNGELPRGSDLHGGNPDAPPAQTMFGVFAPAGEASTVAGAYDRGTCDQRHEVESGFAWAPLSLAPELQFRLTPRVTLATFARLQLVTGSRVYGPDPTISVLPDDPNSSYNRSAYTDSPEDRYRYEVPFTWAAGLKLRYYLGQEEAKFRPFAGVFAGYGQSRLRVNMGFAHDLNGNSVPDNHDVAYDLKAADQSDCVPVWPYVHGCVHPSEQWTEETGMALTLATNANEDVKDGKNVRIDTVLLGPFFAGATFGVHYQVIKNFAIFAEAHAGGWFGPNPTVLFDLNLGPAITF
ncbi:MAG: hypothetical protein B7733_24400 [Myxococcales bacterium FL481]|nr:MAG: hypothetical protein B7733_24400 [Myxococcales bacterium FL481]